jgi:hypothetical protein
MPMIHKSTLKSKSNFQTICKPITDKELLDLSEKALQQFPNLKSSRKEFIIQYSLSLASIKQKVYHLN